MDSLFRELKIYVPSGQLCEPVGGVLLSYEAGRSDPRRRHHRGGLDGFVDGRLRRHPWRTHGPFFIFYSMFGFQRVGDLIWAAADARPQFHDRRDGRSHHPRVRAPTPGWPQPGLASTVPVCRAYPAFA